MNTQYSNKTLFSRFAEVVLSLGIPAVGYLCAMKNINAQWLVWQIPVVLLAAWHVILINDCSFGKKIKLKVIFLAKENLTGTFLVPFFILPSLYLSPFFGIVIFLTIFNWDYYSLKGKRNWLAGLFHNFVGGALHFMIGIAAAAKSANLQFLLQYLPEICFFAFTMTAGAMHHDSFDIKEDKIANYVTGAVKFSANHWWRLALFPFLVGISMLPFCEREFFRSFTVSSVFYLFAYSLVSIKKNPPTITFFRTICRLSFILGATIYLYSHIYSYTFFMK